MTNNQIKFPKPVREGTNNEWGVLADFGDGKMVPLEVARLAVVNDKRHIALLWGESPMSNDNFRYAQAWRVGGGGAVTIMWSRDPRGCLYVGGVVQSRPFIDPDEDIFNVVRGFARPGEDVRDAALRELDEEVGNPDLLVPQPLPGEPVNMDSAFFASQGEEWNGSVSFFHLQVPWSLLREQADGSFAFEIDSVTDEKRKEAIFGAKFVPGDQMIAFAGQPDAFTAIAYFRLVAYFAQQLADQMKKIW